MQVPELFHVHRMSTYCEASQHRLWMVTADHEVAGQSLH
jgi:hypothetical protein